MALNQRSRTVLTLYSAPDCVHCHRVRMALAAKGVIYDHVVVDLDNPPEDLLDLNPYNSVPTLVDRDLVLYDTSVICEYLDENDWLTLVDTIETGGKAADVARKSLRDDLVKNASAFKASKFFLSPEISLADCTLAPLIWRLDALGVQLPREAHAIIDYGERIFRSQGFARIAVDASFVPKFSLLVEDEDMRRRGGPILQSHRLGGAGAWRTGLGRRR